MKVSIITVVYNNELFIKNAIDSVLQQNYLDIEYIIVDGASKDKTIEIIQSYGNKVSLFISEPDRGIYDAINKGIRLATGDIIGILNSDDFFSDNSVINRVVTAFKESNSELIYADVDYINNNSGKIVRHYSSKYFRSWMFRFGIQPAHPTFYTYRENFMKYGLYRTDMKIAGDFELLLRFLYLHKLSYKYINDTWVKMRTGGVSTSGIKSIITLNSEIVKAFRLNGIHTNYVFVFSKYMFKWWSFIKRK